MHAVLSKELLSQSQHKNPNSLIIINQNVIKMHRVVVERDADDDWGQTSWVTVQITEIKPSLSSTVSHSLAHKQPSLTRENRNTSKDRDWIYDLRQDSTWGYTTQTKAEMPKKGKPQSVERL